MLEMYQTNTDSTRLKALKIYL